MTASKTHLTKTHATLDEGVYGSVSKERSCNSAAENLSGGKGFYISDLRLYGWPIVRDRSIHSLTA